MYEWQQRCARDENGASAVEYGLLIAGIAALIVTVVFFFGQAVGDTFDTTCTSIAAGTSGSAGSVSC